jgi:hypothetical protein
MTSKNFVLFGKWPLPLALLSYYTCITKGVHNGKKKQVSKLGLVVTGITSQAVTT